MKNVNPIFKKSIIYSLILSLFGVSFSPETNAQYPGINDSIAKHRRGEIIIQAKQGSQVTIEQMSHEFWFGCAIPNSIVGGMSHNDLRQFKEKFLQNFNSAVTENALKWAIMERRKNEENYTVIDSILSWTEKNHIPLRGHNLFWGIAKSPNTGLQYIQP